MQIYCTTMKNFLLILCLSFLSSVAIAQPSLTGAYIPKNLLLQTDQHRVRNSTPLPQSIQATQAYKYFDEGLPIYDWTVGALYNPLIMILFAERITLSSSTGYVDSVIITFDNVTSDSVSVVLFHDSLYETQPRTFYHLLNIFDPKLTPYAEVRVAKTDIHLGQPTTVLFPHVQVPKEFFVALPIEIDPTTSAISPFTIRGDRGPTHPRTTENARSTAAGVTQSQLTYSILLDSTFVPNGETEPIYSNFYITVYVETSPSSVASSTLLQGVFSAYPNPCNTHTTFFSNDQSFSEGGIEFFDIYGRMVLKQGLNQAGMDCSQLPSGVYRAISHSGGVLNSVTLSVIH